MEHMKRPASARGPLRILAIADIHGATDVYEWLCEAATENRADLVVMAGDLLAGGWEEEQAEHARTVILPLIREIPAPVCYVMGNDDHVDLTPDTPNILAVNGQSVAFGAWSVCGYQYSPPFMGGCNEKPDEQIAVELQQLEPALSETTIFVTHSPAYGFADRIYSGEQAGSRALAGLLARKDVLCHIHGHIHHSFGRAGNHFNVAAGGRRRAMVIDVPSLTHRIIES